MPSIAARPITAVLGFLVIVISNVGGAEAATSVVKPGCPVITRAQAQAAVGDVKKLVYHSEHTPGPGGGVTWLERCRIFFGPGYKSAQPSGRGGTVDVVYNANDRASFDEERQRLLGLGKVQTVRGVGKAAFRYARDPSSDPWELYVFHPSRWSPPGLPPGPEHGSFVVLPDPGVSLPFQSLVALARAALKHPYGPLKKPA